MAGGRVLRRSIRDVTISVACSSRRLNQHRVTSTGRPAQVGPPGGPAQVGDSSVTTCAGSRSPGSVDVIRRRPSVHDFDCLGRTGGDASGLHFWAVGRIKLDRKGVCVAADVPGQQFHQVQRALPGCLRQRGDRHVGSGVGHLSPSVVRPCGPLHGAAFCASLEWRRSADRTGPRARRSPPLVPLSEPTGWPPHVADTTLSLSTEGDAWHRHCQNGSAVVLPHRCGWLHCRRRTPW